MEGTFLGDILAIVAGLAGVGTFVSVLISLLKKLGVIKDGTSQTWYQVASLVVFVAVAALYFVQVPVDWSQVDEWFRVAAIIFGYIVQLLGGQVSYAALKGTPVIGFSYEKQKLAARSSPAKR